MSRHIRGLQIRAAGEAPRAARFEAPTLEALADKLVTRDRDNDSRRLCLECAHLQGVGRWGCGNWKQAAICTRPTDAGLAHVLVVTPQHCPGFKEHMR